MHEVGIGGVGRQGGWCEWVRGEGSRGGGLGDGGDYILSTGWGLEMFGHFFRGIPYVNKKPGHVDC